MIALIIFICMCLIVIFIAYPQIPEYITSIFSKKKPIPTYKGIAYRALRDEELIQLIAYGTEDEHKLAYKEMQRRREVIRIPKRE